MGLGERRRDGHGRRHLEHAFHRHARLFAALRRHLRAGRDRAVDDPGILASGVALHAISQRTDPGFKRLAVGAVLMGAGIGLMHYSGMAAMEPQALLRYDPGLVALSIVVAAGLAFVSLGIRFRFHSVPYPMVATALAAPIMGFAVAGMH